MRLLISLILLIVLPPVVFAGPGFDVIGSYRVYRMVSNTDNSCQVYYMPVPVDIEYDSRDPSIADYQATGSITFGPGFQSGTGDSFIAEIVPGVFGVPQATNLTGAADANMNWLQSTVYDETGKVIGDAKQFYDNAGRGIQSQNKVFYRAGTSTVYTHVFASQSIRDAFNRDAAATLPAPIDYADFSYRSNFLQHNTSGSIYNHQNFDLTSAGGDKTSTPDPLWDVNAATPIQGTLAWYYSKYNNWEPYTPETAYPFDRQTWYQDGTGNTKKRAAAGEPLIMGTGKENSAYIMPVVNELDFYLQVRNKYFATTEVGALPTSLAGQAMQRVFRDPNGIQTIAIEDRSGKSLMTARAGSDITVNNTVSVDPAGVSNKNVFYFRLLASGPVNISAGSFSLEDMNTEQTVSFTSGNVLAAGYYKLSNTGTSALTLTYSNGYTDISYSYYDQNGQLLANIAPEGVKMLYGTNGTGLNAYATRGAVPFISQYTYDQQGRLTGSQDPDRGTRVYIYRNDGKLRFSQNSAQAATGSYSYTNYDQVGRPVEGGQYQPAGDVAFNSPAMTAILETTAPGGGLTVGTKTDVILTQYDLPDQSHGLSAYVQDPFSLAGAVSVVRKYNTITANTPSPANLVSAAWYNYNPEGQTIWKIQYINGLGYKTNDYSYDVLGFLTKRTFQANTSEAFSHIYDYDPANKQLWHVYTSVGNSSPVLQATYKYYLHGGLKRIELAGNLQGIDYAYTLPGGLKAINNSNKSQDPGADGSGNGFSADAFGEVLDYYTGDYVNTKPQIAALKGVDASSVTTESYMGNIKAMSWFSGKPVSTGLSDAPTTYVYQYDPKYQFTESTWGNNLGFSTPAATFSITSFNKEKLGNPGAGIQPYDKNGNILYLQRTDGSGALTDQFAYNYNANTNRLASITATVGGASQTFASYTYDAAGRIIGENTGDPNQKYLVYDVMGKVTMVYRDAAHTQPVAGFVYDESGQRIKKLSYNSSSQLVQVTYYVEDVTYTQPVTNGGTTYGAATAQEYQIQGKGRLGVYYPLGPIYAYELTDHLGNVRAVIAQNGSTLQVRSYTDYYPYGMIISKGGTDYRYGYQGGNAETDQETGWNAFELRMYDSRIARWLQYDPKGQFYSPYMSMGNDPVGRIDPDGGSTDDFIKNLSNGSIFWSDHPDIYTDATKYQNLGANYVSDDGYIYSYTDHVTASPLFDPYNAPTISAYKPTFWQRQEKGNLAQQFFYGIANSFYVTAQNLGIKQLKGRNWAVGLNGHVTTPNENVMSFAGSATWFIPGAGEEAALANTTTHVEETVAEEAVAQVTRNRAAGNAFRDEIASLLEAAGRDVKIEQYKWTPFGPRYIDVEVSMGERVLGGIETKVGKSPYTVLQRVKDAYLWLVHDYRVDLVRKPANW